VATTRSAEWLTVVSCVFHGVARACSLGGPGRCGATATPCARAAWFRGRASRRVWALAGKQYPLHYHGAAISWAKACPISHSTWPRRCRHTFNFVVQHCKAPLQAEPTAECNHTPPSTAPAPELPCALQASSPCAPEFTRQPAMRGENVLLVDFAVYRPPDELKVDYLAVQRASRQWQVSTPTHDSIYMRPRVVGPPRAALSPESRSFSQMKTRAVRA
jgi:hypothetical protein